MSCHSPKYGVSTVVSGVESSELKRKEKQNTMNEKLQDLTVSLRK